MTVTVGSKQSIQKCLPQRYVCVGCKLNCDQTLRSLCLKDTLERVTRRCDDTVDKEQVNSCVLKYLFWELSNPKIAKNPPKCSFRRVTNVMFSKFRGSRRKNKAPALHSVSKPHFVQFWLIINSNSFGAKDYQNLFPSLYSSQPVVPEFLSGSITLSNTSQSSCPCHVCEQVSTQWGMRLTLKKSPR